MSKSKRARRHQVRALAVTLAEVELMLMREMKATVDDTNARLRELALVQDAIRAELRSIAARLDSRDPAEARRPASQLGVDGRPTGPVPPDPTVFQRYAPRTNAGAPDVARTSSDRQPPRGPE